MGLWATQSRGKQLWMKAKAVTITKRLENARVLRPPSAHVERSNHGSYLQKLRLGVKMIAGDSVVANFLNDARANVKGCRRAVEFNRKELEHVRSQIDAIRGALLA